MDELFAAQKDSDTVIMQYRSSLQAADENFSRKVQELSMCKQKLAKIKSDFVVQTQISQEHNRELEQ